MNIEFMRGTLQFKNVVSSCYPSASLLEVRVRLNNVVVGSGNNGDKCCQPHLRVSVGTVEFVSREWTDYLSLDYYYISKWLGDSFITVLANGDLL